MNDSSINNDAVSVESNTFDDNSTKEGWLMKRSKWMKHWRRRYFELIDSNLVFSKDENSLPHGNINLLACVSMKVLSKKKNGYENVIALCCQKDQNHRSSSNTAHSGESSEPNQQLQNQEQQQIYYLSADTTEERDQWIAAIQRFVPLSSDS